MDRHEPTVIVGAGIAGLAMALELARRGVRVALFEAADRIEPVGAGLQLSPNALRVLRNLGLLPALTEAGCAADAVTLRSGRTGRAIAEVPVRGADGTPYLSLHRADLQTALLDAVHASPAITLRLGHRLITANPEDGDLSLQFQTADGSPHKVLAPFVIGADGVRSRLAEAAGLAPAMFTGRVAWRAMLRAHVGEPVPAGIESWLLAGTHAVAYPVSGGERINLVVIAKSPSPNQPGSPPPASMPSIEPRLAGMIRAAEAWSPWPIFEAPAGRPYRLFSDRVLLIGDAAHAMAPFAAQGAALALEDASVAARHLAKASTRGVALAAYEADRRPRIDAVRKRVAFHRLVYHLPWAPALARDTVLGLRSARSLAKDLAWLYDWAPPTDR